jgi:aldose sugar dehydrogenase
VLRQKVSRWAHGTDFWYFTQFQFPPILEVIMRKQIGILLISSGALVAYAAGLAQNQKSWRVETVKSSLERPWSLNFAPDGRLLMTTRNSGNLVALNVKNGDLKTFKTDLPQFRQDGDGGMLGMELDPNFAQNNTVYICYSYWKGGVQSDANKRNRVSSFTVGADAITLKNVLVDDMPGWWSHNGCRIERSPDKKSLFVSMGDADAQVGGPEKAQNLQSLGGKIMRVNLDGSRPADNPFPNSLVWSLGHRNAQGLAFHPVTGALWSTEHGVNVKDELNVIKKGRNYGWPSCEGVIKTCSNVQNYEPAIKEYTPNSAVAMSDMAFYTGSAFPQWKNNLFFVTLKTGRLYRLELNGETVAREEIMIDNDYGRLRDITVGNDGFLYISTDTGPNSSILRLRPTAQ